MAFQKRDLEDSKIPDITDGIPWFEGWLHHLVHRAKFNVAIGDEITVLGRVPRDEWWQVLGMRVTDTTGGGGAQQGWEGQNFNLDLQQWSSPTADAANPKPRGAWTGGAPSLQSIWARAWDGVTPITWGAGGSFGNLFITPANPVWSLTAWPAGSKWSVFSSIAKSATGLEKAFTVHLTVLRVPLGRKLPLDSRAPLDTMQEVLADIDRIAKGQLLKG